MHAVSVFTLLSDELVEVGSIKKTRLGKATPCTSCMKDLAYPPSRCFVFVCFVRGLAAHH